MENNTNKKVIIVTLLINIIIILVASIIEITTEHKNNLLLVTEKAIVESAVNCIKDDTCNNETVTLEELYSEGYLDKISNPITKEYYNEESYVIKKEEYEFIEVN